MPPRNRPIGTRTERIEARLAPDRRDRLQLAASIENVSLSTFVVNAALAHAEEVLATAQTTSVPSSYFDDLLQELDRIDPPNKKLVKAKKQLDSITNN
jgi:uncharacterized protein (DUF1778 family)